VRRHFVVVIPQKDGSVEMYPMLEAQKFFDAGLEQLVEWRKTFAPAKREFGDITPIILDGLYCRDLLRRIPEIVERTRNLSQLTLSEVADRESFVYLREAANCYIFGLDDAAVALARAAVEARLRAATSKVFGKSAMEHTDLKDIINDLAVRLRLLSHKGQALANQVRKAATDVLHYGQQADSAGALAVLEAARRVILELDGR
jgi:hypothetical protein